MITAVLLLVCLVLAGAVMSLVVTLRKVEGRLAALETSPRRSPGFETGASAPSSTSDETPAVPAVAAEEFVITRLGAEAHEPAPVMEGRLFADLVLRESVVKAASWAHGVRSGLSPANRNRIWFEMRREVRRARKERKAEEREAIREYRARRRAAVRLDRRESEAA